MSRPNEPTAPAQTVVARCPVCRAVAEHTRVGKLYECPRCHQVQDLMAETP